MYLRLQDSRELRFHLKNIFPGLHIQELVPTPANQRIVYFCNFEKNTPEPTQEEWDIWGNVVLKVSQGIHPTIIARLEKEISILNSLRSDYFPTLHYYNIFMEDPVTEEVFPHRLFITIENRVEGEPLLNCFDRYSSEKSVVHLLLQFVNALRLLWEHPQRIVHRDLKPANILIKPNGDVVIIDLGLVREEGSPGLTASFAPYGPCTPAYASPEQARNEKKFISFKSDFFALGIISYQLMAGVHPFMKTESDFIDEVLERVISYHPPTLKELGKASNEVSALIERLMTKQPYQRHRTVDLLHADIVRLQKGKG